MSQPKAQQDILKMEWISSCLLFLRHSILEPMVFLQMLSDAFRSIAFHQILQDKICLQHFSDETSIDYCRSIARQPQSALRDNILGSVATYSTYKEFLVVIPGLFSALFIGSWCDRFPNGKRFCLISTSFAMFLESGLLFLNAAFFDIPVFWTIFSYVPPSIFGNEFGFFTALYAYTAVSVVEKEKGVRYFLFPVMMTVGWAIGSYWAGATISSKPYFNSRQLQNYAGNFAFSAITALLLVIWCCVFLKTTPVKKSCNESTESSTRKESTESLELQKVEQEKPKTAESFSIEEPKKICKISAQHYNREEEEEIEIDIDIEFTQQKLPKISAEPDCISQPESIMTSWERIIDMIHYRNVSGVFVTCFRERKGTTVRLRMWMMILTINLALLPSFGKGVVLYPLVQKVYHWDSVQYSNMNSYAGAVHIIGMITIIPILFKVLKVNDCQTSMVGCLMGIAAYIFIGSIVSPVGFYVYALITAFASGSATGCRSYLSKMLPKDEVAKVFAVTLLIEGAVKAVASYFFALILELTIHSYPTFVFHCMGIILIIALIVLVFTDLITKYPLKMYSDGENEIEDSTKM